jgi:hypothetical protein
MSRMNMTTLLTAALAAAALTTGCGGEAPAITESAAAAGLQARAAGPAELQGLAAARAATARFHRFDVADEAGYDFLFMDMCMEDGGGAGGMGYHYVDTRLLDAELDVAHPEAVMYEPGTNGQLRLVGLEYVIPAAAWTSPNPPELLGQQLTLNAFDLWALHVWIWKDNPSGIYADWNPTVSCANAGAVTSRTAAEGGHH